MVSVEEIIYKKDNNKIHGFSGIKLSNGDFISCDFIGIETLLILIELLKIRKLLEDKNV